MSSADRSRRYRQRLARGLAVFPVELGQDEVEALREGEFLGPWAESSEEISLAIRACLRHALQVYDVGPEPDDYPVTRDETDFRNPVEDSNQADMAAIGIDTDDLHFWRKRQS